MEKHTAIVRVHRPELSEKERQKRMEAIKKAAADLIVAAHRVHKQEVTP